MARIPTANDLGRVSARPATGVSSVDISPIARGNQQVADAIGRIGGAFAQVAQEEDRLALGKAQSELIKGQLQLQSDFERDNDYGTMQQRYDDQAGKLSGELANQISSPRLREEFNNWAGIQNARGQQQIRGMAWGKEKDSNIASLTQNLQDNSNSYMNTTDEHAREQIALSTNNLISGATAKNYITATQGQSLSRSWVTDTAKGSVSMLPPQERIKALQSGNGLVSFIAPDDRNRLIEQAQNQLIAIENRARIAEARRESQASRALNEYSMLVDSGLEASDDVRQAMLNAAKGTSLESEANNILNDEVQIKNAVEAGPEAAQQFIDKERANLQENGGDLSQWRSFQRRSAAIQKAQKEWQSVAVMKRYEDSVYNGIPLDPNDKNNQAAADIYFQREIAPELNLNDADGINKVALAVTRTGIIPNQVKSILDATATSKDPAVVVNAAKMYGTIFDNNPAAAIKIGGNTGTYLKKVYDYTESGVDAKQAVDMAYNQVYKQDESLKQLISQQLKSKEYIKDRESAAQKNINALSPSLTSFGSPGIQNAGVSNVQYRRDYQTLYDANFAQAGGDAKQAEALTNAQIKGKWGVTDINGREEVMQYAPEAIYGGNWVRGQWEQERQALKGKSFGGTRSDTELVIVSDALTARNQDYAVMVRQKNANGYDDVRPYYGDNGLPIRFKPDQQTSPMYKQAMMLQKMGVEKARSDRAGTPTSNSGSYINSAQVHEDAQKKFRVSEIQMPTNTDEE